MNKESCVLNPFFKKKYPVITHGKGIYLYDSDENEYIDGTSGAVLVSLGHGMKEMGDALKEQSDKISFVYRWDCVTDVLETACQKICEASDYDFTKVFSVSGGSEAVEITMKLARRYFINIGLDNKYKIISRWQSYHGSTMGALSITGFTGRRKGYDQYLTDFGHIPPAYCYRCWYNKERGKCNFECAQALENEILCQGDDTVAAFIMEPVSGMSICGNYPEEGYYTRIREICDKYNVLLIDDEVMAGIGRTGKYFSYKHFRIIPDIIALGKALSGGYFPIGAVACSEKVYQGLNANSGEFLAGYSWAGNPLGAAVVVKTFEILKKNQLVEKVAKKGEYLLKGLIQMAKKHPSVGEVRGLGLMIGIEFVQDKKTKEPFDAKVKYSSLISKAALEQKMFLETSTGCDKGVRGDMAMVAPAFIVEYTELDEIIRRIDCVISSVEEGLKIY
ncbi:aspartate aminotransferase family protein [Clostridium vincentii]|uniref:Taurine--pyruvate aminotransferase n=1 Tax=Clostridium vincentii TaxID=52704 RepID=A0A2T0BIJ5_9CLOT|nr:aminotransferase class III-fold pyridoxal phosphate-dependent enzyme [Clostridium vincentii]PRR83710.1 Taurine--pyruvate aminotransferase [Clostridium vincentii]